MRLHRKVWIWWGRWWAAQLMINTYFSLGVHIEFRRPYIDVHVGWFIFSIGNRPERSDLIEQVRWTSRGFLRTTDPVL